MNMMKNHKDDDYVKMIKMKLEIEAYFVAILVQIHVAYGHRQDKKGHQIRFKVMMTVTGKAKNRVTKNCLL